MKRFCPLVVALLSFPDNSAAVVCQKLIAAFIPKTSLQHTVAIRLTVLR